MQETTDKNVLIRIFQISYMSNFKQNYGYV